MIHKTALIHPHAKIDSSASVGPYAVIDENVIVGANCKIGPHVYLTGKTTIGKNNIFHASAVIGDAPQDLKYKDEPTGLRIGDGNIFREHVTIHRSNKLDEETVIGAENFFMASSHVGHNCQMGNKNVMANGAMLGGHVTVGDGIFFGGNCGVHQFVRIGNLALLQGNSGASKDVPPFAILRDINILCGLNVVGMRRAGMTSAQRLELKKLYHALFRSGKNLKMALAEANENFTSAVARLLLDFVAQSKRGVCLEEGGRLNPRMNLNKRN
ncbi:MAG: acyl-ACP--UDP-N-acetylglucosamine O-acyltransferase [Limisphaerales bacterium]